MRTRHLRIELPIFAVVALIVGGAALGACTTSGVRGGLTKDVIAQLPSNLAHPYQVFAHRCSRCHTLARPLTAQVETLEHWRLYVARMQRQPGSGISDTDALQILEFLGYYSAKKARIGIGLKPETPPAPSPEGEEQDDGTPAPSPAPPLSPPNSESPQGRAGEPRPEVVF